MSDDKVFKIVGEFISYEEKEFGGVNKYIISYKQPNSQDPSKVWKHQAVEADLSDKAIEILVSASAGERMCVHQGKEGGYPIIKDITDVKDAPVKGSGGGSKYKPGGGGNYTPKDETGIAVGAAYTNAIEVIKLHGVAGNTIEETIAEVAAIAEKILKNKLELEDKLRASKAAKTAVTEKAKEAAPPKPLSRAEQLKAKKAQEAKAKPVVGEEESLEDLQDELTDDDLDDVKFD